MNENYLYKCTNCETVKATSEDLGESTWVLYCTSIRCQGTVMEHYRLDIYVGGVNTGHEVKIVCKKEVMGDDSDEEEIGKINEHRSVNQ